MATSHLLSEESLLDFRPRLCRYFSARGRAWAADELADEVVLRVLQKARKGDVIENPGAYTLGVARLVLLEHLRGPVSKHEPLEGDFLAAETSVANPTQDCLDRCLSQLPEGLRSLILRFYGLGREDAKPKDVRRRLAEETGISIDALFIRASRARQSLRVCIDGCLNERGAGDA